MQAPTAPAGSNANQHHTMSGATGQPAGAAGTGCNCGSHGGQSGSATTAGQQRQPGLNSTATVEGQSLSESLAGVFAPGTLDREDALLLWTGVNSVLFAALVYVEVAR